MKQIAEFTIEKDRITSSTIDYPLNATSAVWIKEEKALTGVARWAVGMGAIAVGAATGGLALPLLGAAGVAYAGMSTAKLIVRTNGTEYVILKVSATVGLGKERVKLLYDLKEAISEALGQDNA